MNERPFVVTFYSYKGGVGRTTLAINTAVALAKVGKTLLWDLDVEAPGLQHVTALRAAKPPSQGYFSPLLQWQKAGCPTKLDKKALRAWDACLWPVQAEPRLSLLPASVDASGQLGSYVQIDWVGHFAREPDKGLALIDALLAHWHTSGFEFVVIDSRTGITDLGALLTAVVPDVTVLVGNFGVQNVSGLALAWRALQPATQELAKRAERGRSPLVRELVASPIPTVDSERRAAGYKVWEEHFGLRPTEWVEIPEDEQLRYSEKIGLLELPQDHRLNDAYRELTRRLLQVREAQRDAALAERQASTLYPETATARGGRLGAAERGRDSQRRGRSFEEQVAHVLQMLRYSVERETLVDANRFDLIATTRGTLEDTTYFVECKDTQVTKDMVDRLATWVSHPQARARQARAMIVGRGFAPAALQQAKNQNVQCFTLAQLEARLFDFKPYLAQLRSGFEQSRLAECYVAQQVRRDSTGDERNSAEPAVEILPLALEWAGGKGKPLWVLLGDYGTGKTAFTQRFAYELARRTETDPSAPVPLLINLRDYPNATQLAGVIDEHLAKTVNERGRADAVLHLLARGRCVLLLDSFDEMGLAAVGVSVDEQFRQLALPTALERDENGGRVLITSREEFFRERVEAESVTRGGGDGLARPGSMLERAARAFDAQIDTLPYFSREQVAEYLGKRLGDSEGRAALARIDTIHGLADLATRPQLLDIVLESLPDLASSGQVINAGVLYHSYVSRWLTRHRPAGARLSVDEVRQLLEQLAEILWARGAAPLHYAQLAETVRGFQSLFPARDPVHVDLELRTAAFLTRSPDGHYRFSHRSFLEFFYARRLLRLAQDGDESGFATALAGAPLRVEVVRFFADLWQGNDHRAPCSIGARLLAVQQVPMVASNLLRLALWLGEHAAQSCAQGDQDARDAARRLAWAAALPQPPQRAMLAGTDLSRMQLAAMPLNGALLDGADLDRCDLRGASLEGASLVSASAEDARFDGASSAGLSAQRLRAIGSRWAGAQVSGADFAGASLRNSDWRGAEIGGTVFAGADLTLARLESRHSLQFVGAELAHASMVRGLARPPIPKPKYKPHWRELPMGGVNALAYSPDGTRLASGGGDGTLRLWDAASGKELRRFEGHGGSVRSVAYSPDGTLLASGSNDGTLRLWNAASGMELRRFEGHRGLVLSVAFSRNGTLLASGGDDGTLRLWDASSGKELRRFRGHGGQVLSVAYSPDGTRLASGGGDGTLRLWDATTGKELRRLEGHGDWVRSVTYSPDGTRLTSGGDDGTVRLWDAASGRELRRIEGHGGWVQSVAYSAGGRLLASGSNDGTVRMWDATSGRELRRWEVHGDWVRSVAFSPDGTRLASGGDDDTLRLWHAASGKELRRLEGHRGSVLSAAFSPDGTLLASGNNDGTVRMWDAASGKELRRWEVQRGLLLSVAYSSDGQRLASGGDDGMLRLWDAASGRELRRLEGHRGSVLSVAFSPDGTQLASGGGDGTLRLWDTASGKELRRFGEHRGPVLSVAFPRNGGLLASGGSDGTLRLWDAARGSELHRFEEHRGRVQSVAFSPDGMRLASGRSDGTLLLWHTASGRALHRLGGHRGSVLSVAFSPGGQLLASGGGDGTLRLWGAGGKQLCVIEGRGGPVHSVALARCGALAAANQLISLFDAEQLRAQSESEAHTNWRWQNRIVADAVTLYPDGRHAGSGEALEWLEYEELPQDGAESAPQDPVPTLHRATDVPWMHVDYEPDTKQP